MDKNEFKIARFNAGWSMAECARQIGVTIAMAYKYEQGKHAIPAPIEKLMCLLAKPKVEVTRS